MTPVQRNENYVVTDKPCGGGSFQSQSVSYTSRAGGRGRGGNRPQRRNRNTDFPLLNESPQNFKKFFLIRDAEGENLWEKLETIYANRELEKALKGEPKRITELRNGSILVEVLNNEQSTRIRQIQKLNNIKVIVEEHGSLNFTKGTIFSRRFVEINVETT